MASVHTTVTVQAFNGLEQEVNLNNRRLYLLVYYQCNWFKFKFIIFSGYLRAPSECRIESHILFYTFNKLLPLLSH